MDIKGDKEKQPVECDEDTKCPNIKCVYEGWDDETWRCDVCGAYFKIYYEEMQ